MRKYLAVLVAAVLIFGSMATVVGKVQDKSDAKGGHHNAIVGDVGKINGNNNVPYGQLKKVGDGNLAKSAAYGLIEQGAPLDRNGGKGVAAGNLSQIADFNGQILGGHHNTIVLESGQVAIMGASQAPGANETGPGSNETGSGSPTLNQVSDIDGQIYGGHHNLIFVDGSQIAWAEGATSVDLVQVSDIDGQILDGHHNTIVLGSLQAFDAN